jgi:small-conductance mechanosensitive channel
MFAVLLGAARAQPPGRPAGSLLGIPLGERPPPPAVAAEVPALMARLAASREQAQGELAGAADEDRSAWTAVVRAVERQIQAATKLQDTLRSSAAAAVEATGLEASLAAIVAAKEAERASLEEERRSPPSEPAALEGLSLQALASRRTALAQELQAARERLEACLAELRLHQRTVEETSTALLKRPDDEEAARRAEAAARSRLRELQTEILTASDPGSPRYVGRIEEAHAVLLEAEAHRALAHYLGSPKDGLLSAQLERAQHERELLNLQRRREEIRIARLEAEVDQLHKRELSLIVADADSVDAALSEARPHERPLLLMRRRLHEIQHDTAAAGEALELLRSRLGPNGPVAVIADEIASASADLAAGDGDEALLAAEDTPLLRSRIEQLRSDAAILDATLRDVELTLARGRRAIRALDEEEKGLAQRLAAELEAARAAAAGGFELDYYVQEENWDALGRELAGALRSAIDLRRRGFTILEGAPARLRELREKVGSLLRVLGPRLFWARESSGITVAALRQAAAELGTLPDAAWKGGTGLFAEGRRFVADPQQRMSTVIAAALTGLLVALGYVIHRRLPRTCSRLEAASHGPAGRAARILATFVRRTEVVLMVAVGYLVLCVVLGQDPRRQPILTVLLLAPLAYRLLRVGLDILLAPEQPAERLVRVDDYLAEVLHRTGRALLWVSMLFVPTGLILQETAFGRGHPGFLELWDLIHQVLVFAILLIGLFRPALVLHLVRGRLPLSTPAKLFILVALPALAGALVGMAILRGLRYEIARSAFVVIFAEAAGILAGAYWIYRFLLGRLLGDRADRLHERVLREDFDDVPSYLAAGRRSAWDRLLRLLLRVLIFGPACFWIASLWQRLSEQAFPPAATGAALGLGLRALQGVGVALGVWIVVGHYRRMMRFVVLPRTRLDQGLQYAVLMLSTYFLAGVGIVAALKVLDVRGDQIGLVIGALSVGIGFGLQDVVKSFVAGLILLVERPIKVGDQISVGGQVGVVDQINLRSTTVLTFDNVGIVVPNDQLVSGTLSNRAGGSALIRTRMPVSISYDSDVKLAARIMLESMQSHGLVRKKPAPEVFLVNFGASGIEFELRFWTLVTDHRLRIASDIRQILFAQFRKAGISIPYGTLDLNLRRGPWDRVLDLPGAEEVPIEQPVRKASAAGEGEPA